MLPPIEMPTMCARSIRSASIRPTASSAIISIEYGMSGLSLRPAPRLSKAITRLPSTSRAMMPPDVLTSLPRPPIRSTGRPSPRTS